MEGVTADGHREEKYKRSVVWRAAARLPDVPSDSGALRFCEDMEREGELFEVAAELAEKLCASSLTVALDCAPADNEEGFCDRAEALFRAAVYGNLELMLSDACSVAEARRSFELLHACFCRLLEEGREFNGYIAKGMLISSPVMLLQARSLPRCDFLCFDYTLLCSRLTGARDRASLLRSRDGLRSFWERWRAENESLCRSRELRAICGGEEGDEFFLEWADFMDIREIYVEKRV